MIRLWQRLNNFPRIGRWAIKIACFGLVLLFVLFPDPRLLIRHAEHWNRIDALVRPDADGLEPLQRELDPLLEGIDSDRERLRVVQDFVERMIPYEWDWNTWGAMDYLPTVEEVLAKRKEDCDGRAVLAASLLRGRGYDARLVANFAHMWVWTKNGETMHPMPRKAFEPTAKGKRMRFRWKALADLPTYFAFGTAVFPLPRNLIILVTLWGLLLGARVRWPVAVPGLAFMLVTLWIWRFAASDPYHIDRWGCWMGFVVVFVGVALTWMSGSKGSPGKTPQSALATGEVVAASTVSPSSSQPPTRV